MRLSSYICMFSFFSCCFFSAAHLMQDSRPFPSVPPQMLQPLVQRVLHSASVSSFLQNLQAPWEQINYDNKGSGHWGLTDLSVLTQGAVCTALAGFVLGAVATFLTEVVQKLPSLRFLREESEQYKQGSEDEDQLVHLQGMQIGMKRSVECWALLSVKTCNLWLW